MQSAKKCLNTMGRFSKKKKSGLRKKTMEPSGSTATTINIRENGMLKFQ